MREADHQRYGSPSCLPRGAHYCELAQRSDHDGISLDFRRYGWTSPAEGYFAPQHLFLDYAMTGRGERAFMLSGEGRRYLQPGSLVLMTPDANFQTYCDPSDHKSFCVSYDQRRLSMLTDDHNIRTGLIEPSLDLRGAAITRYIVRAIEELRRPGFASDVMTELVVDAVMIEVARHFMTVRDNEPNQGGTMAAWRLRWLKQRIADGLDEPLSIALLARECGISSRHLTRTFKNTAGMTINAYIGELRIARAKALLAEGLPLKVIAGKCGFSSPSSFSGAFLNATGLTPKAFRDAISL